MAKRTWQQLSDEVNFEPSATVDSHVGATSAHLWDTEQALLRAKGSAHAAAAELVGPRQARVLQLIEQLEQALAWTQRVEFHVRADELAGNPHPFAEGVR